MLTVELMQKSLPKHMRSKANQEFVDRVNSALTNPDTAELLRENILGYSAILAEGRFTLDNYVSAVKFVSYMSMGKNNTEAFVATFPERYQDYKTRNVAPKDIASYISAYAKNKLVILVSEQSMIPTYILNQDIHQEAVNHLAYLMRHAQSEKVQSDSAGLLLTHLKRPEKQKVELDINVKENPMMEDLRRLTLEFAKVQHERVVNGDMTALQIAHQSIITDAEYSE